MTYRRKHPLFALFLAITLSLFLCRGTYAAPTDSGLAIKLRAVKSSNTKSVPKAGTNPKANPKAPSATERSGSCSLGKTPKRARDMRVLLGWKGLMNPDPKLAKAFEKNLKISGGGELGKVLYIADASILSSD